MATNVIVLVVATVLAQAGSQYTQFGEHTERGGTRVAYWNAEKQQAAGEVAINFGRPEWKLEYDGRLDAMTAGKMWRMGENFWTSLDTNIPLTIADVDVAVGYYYLAVTRSEDGSRWNLVLIDPVETRKKRIDPYEVAARSDEVPVRFEVPLKFEARDEAQDPLDIRLSEERLVIAWGSFELSAPVSVSPR